MRWWSKLNLVSGRFCKISNTRILNGFSGEYLTDMFYDSIDYGQIFLRSFYLCQQINNNEKMRIVKHLLFASGIIGIKNVFLPILKIDQQYTCQVLEYGIFIINLRFVCKWIDHKSISIALHAFVYFLKLFFVTNSTAINFWL